MTTTTKALRILALLLTLALVLTACGRGGGEEAGGGEAGGSEGGEGSDTVTLLHGIKGENEQAALQKALDAFEESTGKTVEVEFSPQFETVVVTRVQGGNPPDVALYPQPALLQKTLKNATPLEEAGVNVEEMTGGLVPGMIEAGTFEDKAYGVVIKQNMKSLLWYPADDFKKENLEPPKTWDEMLTLSEDIAAKGTPPWCIGIESAEATGWVATDWIEDIMLRLHGEEVYDQWVAGEVKFDSPEVKEAFTMLEEIWFNKDYVNGGTTAILQTPFLDSVQPMFEDPAGCYLHRQAGFVEGEFPDDAKLGEDYDVAALPPIEGDAPPALFAGDVAAVHTDNASGGEFIQFLVSAEGQKAWLSEEGAGALSVRKDFNPEDYPTESLAVQGEIFAKAPFARFDASDLMPSEVGAGAFWRETVAWISGSQDLDTTLKNIDSAFPAE